MGAQSRGVGARLTIASGVEVPVRARPAGIDEVEEVWTRATAIYPGYAKYTERAAHRVIRVFVLEAPGTD